jgi:hypothetical protein
MCAAVTTYFSVELNQFLAFIAACILLIARLSQVVFFGRQKAHNKAERPEEQADEHP